MFRLTQGDIDFLLQQINFGTNPNPLDPTDPSGIRNVDGTFNNPNHPNTFGTTDQPFIHLTTPQFRNGPAADNQTLPGFGPLLFGDDYAQGKNVVDSSPRIISNLISDMSNAPASAVGNTPNDPEMRPFNSWFTTFGQFFDHGLDFVNKGGSGLIAIPILPGDPLYDPTPGAVNMMFQTRATVVSGETINSTAPLIDQSQTYGSHAATAFWLKEFVNGQFTGRLVTGSDGGMATWADVKANSQRLFEAGLSTIVLNDSDISNLRGPDGERSGQMFLADIAHTANPGNFNALKTPDADTVAGVDDGNPNTYDNELLDLHYISGDARTNENIALTAFHEVFHNEHNRLVEDIKQMIADREVIEPGFASQWDGEKIFQAAKLVNEMQYQHLVFEEFARRISPNIDAFRAYDVNINPNIFGEFAHAAYRLGHSMITDTVNFQDGGDNAGSFTLVEAFLNPQLFAQRGADEIAEGMARIEGNEIDEFVVGSVRNFLVGLPLDLAALNIARGRETGVGTLNQVRADLFSQTNNASLAPYTSWSDFGDNLHNPTSLVNFIAAYARDAGIAAARASGDLAQARALAQAKLADANFMGNGGDQGFNDIDLWIGGLAEAKVDRGLLGSTFDFIFALQMINLQDGDRFYYLGRNLGNILDQIESETFADLISRGSGAYHMYGDAFSTADEHIELTYQSASLIDAQTEVIGGTLASDNINGLGGDDAIYGERGNDTLNGGAGNDFVYGGWGNDSINDSGGDDFLRGDEGNDTILGNAGDDHVIGSEGHDSLSGGIGADEVVGGAGNDTVNGDGGDDDLFGGEGNDVMNGGANLDRMIGDDGHDTMNGGAGNDTVDGGNGQDILIGGGGADILNGGGTDDEYDVASYETAGGAVLVDLQTPVDNTGDAAGDTYVAIEEIRGSGFNDTINGDGTSNALRGGDGNDNLAGRGGADILEGGAGNDDISGGGGFDIAVFNGNSGAYTISGLPGDPITVTGPDGTDTLNGIEALQFEDRIIDISGGNLPLVTLLGVQPTRPEGNIAGGAFLVATINVADPDNTGTNVLSLSGMDAGDFEIRAGGTQLWFVGPALNYEAQTTYDVTVNVNDTAAGGDIDSFANYRLEVTDVNDVRPTIISHSKVNVREGTPTNRPIFHTVFDDRDTVGSHTFTLGGANAGLFTIDAMGDVRFAGAAAPPVGTYNITVGVSDGVGAPVTKNVQIVVNNAPPVITSGGTVNYAENGTGPVVDVDANDAGGGSLTYSLAGRDAHAFTINSINGIINFVASPDFELPTDYDGDNVYKIQVNVSDGTLVTTQNITVNVTNVHSQTVTGNNANNSLTASSGEDSIFGLGGNDTLNGGSGNDVLTGGPGSDSLVGGSGIDIASYAGEGAVIINLATNSRGGAASGDTYNSIERFMGSNTGNDSMTGGTGADTFIGLGGNDNLNGGAGNDTLFGGAGNDTITGAAGTDVMYGGEGNDIFDFNATTESTNAAPDIIHHFGAAGDLDRIDLNTIDANTTSAGNQDFSFVVGAFTAAGQVRATQSGNDVLVQVNTDGNTATTEMTIRLTNVAVATINAADFIL